MSKAFLAAMVILTFISFGVVNFVITQNSINIENEASRIYYPASLNRTIPDEAAKKEENPLANDTQTPSAQVPAENENCVAMSYEEAKNLALSGDCGEAGTLAEIHYCNETTKTWWIDLNIDKPGCSPACVINAETKASEINWRCTGATPVLENPEIPANSLNSAPEALPTADLETPAAN